VALFLFLRKKERWQPLLSALFLFQISINMSTLLKPLSVREKLQIVDKNRHLKALDTNIKKNKPINKIK